MFSVSIMVSWGGGSSWDGWKRV